MGDILFFDFEAPLKHHACTSLDMLAPTASVDGLVSFGRHLDNGTESSWDKNVPGWSRQRGVIDGGLQGVRRVLRSQKVRVLWWSGQKQAASQVGIINKPSTASTFSD